MFRNKLRPITIKRQLLLITMLFSLCIGTVISVTYYITYSRYLERNIIQTTNSKLLYLSDYIDQELNNVNTLVQYCQNNNKIIAFVESKNFSVSKRNEAYEALMEYTQNNSASDYLHRVAITNQANSFIQIVSTSYSSTANIAELLPEQPFFQELIADDYTDYTIGFVDDTFYPSRSKRVTLLLRPIAYKFYSTRAGYMFVEISDKLFADAMDNTFQGEGDLIFLTLGEHTYLYKDGSFFETEPNYTILSDIASSDGYETANTNMMAKRIQGADDREYISITKQLQYANCYVTQLIDPAQAHPQGATFFYTIALILLVLMAVGILLNTLLNRTINVPVAKIQHRLLGIAAGDFSRDSSIEWQHEFGYIGKGVNDLAENVDQLIQTTLEDEKQKRDLEYKMLQSQINPHFLYNTLNSIKWMATIQGATGITEMTTALSRLLKSISKGTKLLIPLREELDLLQDYFTIQQYRYGGTIQMKVSVEEEPLYDCSIIKFTLQPLVENAIFHGIEPTGGSGEITVHVYAVDADVRIDITDNGVGMSEEMIHKILTDESVNTSDFFKEIGVSNVHKRLQYEFGEAYGITIKSELGKYTTMSILIPRHHS